MYLFSCICSDRQQKVHSFFFLVCLTQMSLFFGVKIAKRDVYFVNKYFFFFFKLLPLFSKEVTVKTFYNKNIVIKDFYLKL